MVKGIKWKVLLEPRWKNVVGVISNALMRAIVSFHSFILWSNYYDRTIIAIEMEKVMEYHGSFSFTLTLVWATDYLSQDKCSNPCISPGKSDSSRTTDNCHFWTPGHIFSS